MASKKAMPRVKVKKSSAGLGLFADEDIKRSQTIIEYTGEKITSKEADKRGGLYLFTVNRKWVIDGKGRENKARYINHGCKPNAFAEHDGEKIFIRAKKNIKTGEEITYNYGKEYTKEMFKEKGCLCKSCLNT